MHDAFASKVNAKDVGQLLHEDVGHLKRPDDDLQVLRGHHPGQRGGDVVISEDKLEDRRRRVIQHPEKRSNASMANGGAGRRAKDQVEDEEERLDEPRRQLGIRLHQFRACVRL